MAGRRLIGSVVLTVFLGGPAIAAEPHRADASCAWLQAAGVDEALAPDAARLDASPTRQRQLPLYRELMQRPLAAPCRAGAMFDEVRQRIDSPLDLLRWAARHAGIEPSPPHRVAVVESGGVNGDAADPLVAAFDWMRPMAHASGSAWPPPLPDPAALPEPLRSEIARLLAAIGRAHRLLELALARLPPALTAQALRSQLTPAAAAVAPVDEADIRRLLPLLDREALLAGMVELVAATERLQRAVATAPALPRTAWQVDTPLGAVVVDTTGRDNTHRLAAPLLVLDVGGDDHYEFTAAPPARRIAVVLDHGGDDRYTAHVDGADPSAATLGYGILWDSDGDDRYQGTQFAQAAALFGAALLLDGGGANRFSAAAHAQGYALGGIALLAGGAGDDEYSAQTHAQGSAGPQAVALLIDRGGDDRYTLGNFPLLRPSPQLPTHNTSMGQGAGRGLRGDEADSAAGGIGMLIDVAGNDRYAAQVFAQGAGFHEGLGVLIDGGGEDRFDAAWYAMGAAAHSAAGVLLKRGSGNDRYRATHSTSLGAAHDHSVAAFLDEGGDDDYALGDLGLGAAHDDGVALFVDLAGRDRYAVEAVACRAFGVTVRSEPAARADLPAAGGLFVDLDSINDEVVAACEPVHGRSRSAPAASAR